MATPFIKVVHKDKSTNVETIISKYISDIKINLNSDVKKNTVNITLDNNIRRLNSIDLTLDDSIIIYIDWIPITTQNPIISSFIYGISTSSNKTKRLIKLKCVDKTELLLGKLWAKSYTETNALTVDEVIKNVIDNTTSDGFGSTQITYNNVSSTKSDGTAFTQTVNMSKVWKPLYEWIAELSTPTYTGDDRTYVFYIDKDNDLHWEYPFQKSDIYLTTNLLNNETTITVDSTLSYPSVGLLSLGSETILYTGKTLTTFTGCTRGYNNTTATDRIIGDKISAVIIKEGDKNVKDVSIEQSNSKSVNFIIYNAGPTPANFDYLFYEFDTTSADKEFRMQKFEWKDIGQSMINHEKARSDWTDKTTSYPTYPWIPYWSSISVSNDSDYQSSFITEIERVAGGKAKDIFKSVGEAKFKSKVVMKGNLNYKINDMATIISYSQGLVKSLRIKSINHQITKAGFQTQIDLSEDEKKIGA